MPAYIPAGWQSRVNALQANTNSFLHIGYNTSAISLGGGVFLTAAHCGAPEGVCDVQYIEYKMPNGKVVRPDLLLYRKKDALEDPFLPITQSLPPNGHPIIHAGLSKKRSSSEHFAPGRIMYSLPPLASSHDPYVSPLLVFTALPFKDGDSAVALTKGDSGGAVFTFNSFEKRWELLGIIVKTLNYPMHLTNGEIVPVPTFQGAAVDLSYPPITAKIEAYRARSFNFGPGILEEHWPQFTALALTPLLLSRRRRRSALK
jgi:hypothetical protein